MLYELFADGSCSLHRKRAGWGFVLKSPYSEIQGCGFEHGTAVNKMELLAVIKGLQKLPADCKEVHIYTDSVFVIEGQPKARQPINKLRLRLFCLLARHKTKFIKVGCNNKHPNHKRAHHLAREAVFNKLELSGDFNVSCSSLRQEGQSINDQGSLGESSALGTMRLSYV